MERVPVLVDTFSSPSEIEALQGALRRVGLEAEVEQTVPPQGLAPWLVLIGVPVGQFLAGFFGAAGKDAWEAFKQFCDEIKSSHEPKRRFWQRRTAPRQGELVIRPNIETPAEMEPSERAAVMMGWIGTGDTANHTGTSLESPRRGLPRPVRNRPLQVQRSRRKGGNRGRGVAPGGVGGCPGIGNIARAFGTAGAEPRQRCRSFARAPRHDSPGIVKPGQTFP